MTRCTRHHARKRIVQIAILAGLALVGRLVFDRGWLETASSTQPLSAAVPAGKPVQTEPHRTDIAKTQGSDERSW